MTDAFSDKNVIRTKTFLFVADLARKGPRFHGKKSQLYMWNLLIVICLNFCIGGVSIESLLFSPFLFKVAIFYALPVLQLVIIYQKVTVDLSLFRFVADRLYTFTAKGVERYRRPGFVLL